MFNQFFKHTKALNAPLLEERLRYLTYRAEQGTAPTVLIEISTYQLIIIKYLHLKKNDRIITLKELESAAKRWAYRQMRRLKRVTRFSREGRFIRHAKHWLQFLGRIEIPKKPPLPSQVAEFLDYMRKEQSLSDTTICFRRKQLQKFFGQIKEELRQFLAHLTPAQLDAIQIQILNQEIYSRRTIQEFCKTLRAFFRYAERRSWCRDGIADSIQIPRVYKHETLPSSPSWEDVHVFLKLRKGIAYGIFAPVPS